MAAGNPRTGKSIQSKAYASLPPLGAMKRSTILLVFMMAACQQAVSTPTTSASSPKSAVQPVPGSEAASRAPTSEVKNWKLSLSPGEGGTYRIHVLGADGRELQVLDGPEGDPPYEAAALLKLDDFTGDGKLDILARGPTAGSSALASESIYVYDMDSGRFLDAEPFENDGEVTKTGPGCIAVEHRNPDNMTYSKDQYCWKGKWVLKGR